MAVKTKKNLPLKPYTALVHCNDTLERYTAHIQLMDINDGEEINRAVCDWLDSNSGEVEPWNYESFTIDSLFEGLLVSIDTAHTGLSALRAKLLKTVTVVRELNIGSDVVLLMCLNKTGSVSVHEFTKKGNDWHANRLLSDGDYCEAVDLFIERLAQASGITYEYIQNIADPF